MASIDGGGDVYTVAEGDLAVVTSGVTPGCLQGLSRAEAVRYLGAHQRVLETVQRDFPILPVKFGTTLPDEPRLRALLRQGGDLFRATLAEYAGKEQHEVVVLWDVAQVFQAISADEQILALKQQIAALPPEESKQGRVLLGQVVHQALQERRAVIAQKVLAALDSLATDCIANPLMDDSMVCNVALLINSAQSVELDDRLNALDAHFGGKLQIRCVGPLPPYSFATLEVQRPEAKDVAAARIRLGLAETSSFAEVKGAYRRLAARVHPDHNPGDVAAVAEMEALTESYKLLTAVAQAQAPKDLAGDWTCRFDREAVEDTLLLALRRQEVAQ